MNHPQRVNDQGWYPVRSDMTMGVTGQVLFEGASKVVLTRVAPGGAFRPHRDTYGHLFYFLSGSGRVQVEGTWFEVEAGYRLNIKSGELHGYENLGEDDLMLISFNLY